MDIIVPGRRLEIWWPSNGSYETMYTTMCQIMLYQKSLNFLIRTEQTVGNLIDTWTNSTALRAVSRLFSQHFYSPEARWAWLRHACKTSKVRIRTSQTNNIFMLFWMSNWTDFKLLDQTLCSLSTFKSYASTETLYFNAQLKGIKVGISNV